MRRGIEMYKNPIEFENGSIDKPTYDECITNVYLSALQAISYCNYKTIYDECTE